jgi:diaminohydroxyphosphoribosylaminopyrimidine deaminase / 5-amino-6-(5-phosphoribosylamino)uracil reductase
MFFSENDEIFMRQALEQAQLGWGMTHPNPMVGAVIVEQGKVTARGYHAKAGQAHAEAMALSNKQVTPDSTLYVTLEPCCTQGSTGPCTETIIQSGIKRVVIGTLDPNPVHTGKGICILQDAGIEVKTGVLEKECQDLNLIFNYWITKQSPLFAGKLAITLDGRIATVTGKSRWITEDQAREDVMRWRCYFPSVAVGSTTLLKDNPRLTRRLEKQSSPTRFVFDRTLSTLSMPLRELYIDQFKANTIIVTSQAAVQSKKHWLDDIGICYWALSCYNGVAFFQEFRHRCYEAGITGVYFEGGSKLMSALLATRQLDYLFIYRSPKFFADASALPAFSGQNVLSIDQAFSLQQVRHEIFGNDSLMRGHIVYPQNSKQNEIISGYQ